MPRKVKTICQNLGNDRLGKNNTLTKDPKKCTPCDILYDKISARFDGENYLFSYFFIASLMVISEVYLEPS